MRVAVRGKFRSEGSNFRENSTTNSRSESSSTWDSNNKIHLT